MTFPLLTVLALAPLVGALVLLLPIKGAAPRWIGLLFSLATLVLAVVAALRFDIHNPTMQLTESVGWIPQFGAHYALGLNGIGLTLVLLTAILVPVVLIAGWNTGQRSATATSADTRWSPKAFFGLVLVLEALSLYVFLATDVLLFYLFFELTLIPMYFLIGGFGKGRRRSYAAIKFLLFSLAGGLVMLASVIGLYVVSSHTDTGASYLLSDLMKINIPVVTQRWLFVGFMFAFAVKAPMVPFHTWLPDAAQESTPGGATLMVGILDKIGTFGMIRFCLGLFPEASTWATPVIIALALVSILYGALAAIGQKDLMRLISFTSISHFGFIVLGIFAFTSQSMTGSTLYMLNHGFSTAALFLAVGFMISRRGSANITDFGGVQKVAPVLAGVTLVAGLSSLSLPGLSSFVSEFMVLAGTFTRYPVYAVVATLAIVLAALYILIMYQRTMTGPVTAQVTAIPDLNGRERLALAPLLVLIVVLGFFPRPALAIIEPAIAATMQHVGVVDPGAIVGQAGTS
ncbi:MAG: NADH-quinone oxidoreductase subunit M [Propionibacteriaceae bacterium]